MEKRIKIGLPDIRVPNGNAVEFLDWFTLKLNSIPEEFRSSAIYETYDDGDGYGLNWVSATFYYYRPETEEEKKKREELDKKRIENIRIRDLRHYAQIKSKYGI